MPDALSAEELRAIRAFPQRKVKRIAQGVSGLPQYQWMDGALVPSEPCGWRVSNRRIMGKRLHAIKLGQAKRAAEQSEKMHTRREAIVGLYGHLSQHEMAARFGMNVSTIRNDFIVLRREGRIPQERKSRNV